MGKSMKKTMNVDYMSTKIVEMNGISVKVTLNHEGS